MSSDHLIRAEKHRLWNRQADLFGCLEIDHKLEFCRLFYWQFTWLCAFENLVDITGCAAKQIGSIGAIGHERTGIRVFEATVHRRQASLGFQFYKSGSLI